MSAAGPAGDAITTPGAEARLAVDSLQVRLAAGGATVVDEVSFSVLAGEVLGLVGESGSGKTTVALALLGHARRGLEISGGAVRLDGENLLSLKPAALRAARGARVAYVPQDPASALNPTLRIGPQLRNVLKSHPGAADDADARLAEVMAGARLDPGSGILRRYPHQLSGGQQQRVAIAMAFVCRPSVIVLDEPTTGLDVSTQRHILETVRVLCASSGVAAVYVSHDLAVVSSLASQAAVMYAGRIVELGPSDRLFSSPIHPYTRGLLAAVPSSERSEVLVGMPGQSPRPGHRPKGCSFAPRCQYAIADCELAPPPSVAIGGRFVRCRRAGEMSDELPEPRRGLAVGNHGTHAPVLVVRDVSASYGREAVLHHVGLELAPESCLAIVGESGSGKTTLARSIVGLHDQRTGRIIFDGELLGSGVRLRRKESLRRVQYVFQNPYTSLNPRRTIEEILSQPLRHFFDLTQRERSDRVIGVLEDVSLGGDVLKRYPDQLSGGERQRVAIARALVTEPDLLVCDEVTSALDVSVQAVIVEMLQRLQRERRLAMIFITHNLGLVRSIAQSVVVLRAGRVVETGPVNDILEQPQDPYTITLIRDLPKIPQ